MTIKVLDFNLVEATAAVVSTTGATQIAVLGTAFLLAWLLARTVRPRLPDKLTPGFAKIGAGSADRLLLPLVFLILAWLARLLLAKYQTVAILNIAMPLILSFVVIRLALYLLRHLIPPSAALKSSERFIAFTVWSLLALYLTGVLPEILGALEDTTITLNTQEISLRQIVEALLLAVITVFIALSLSRLFEKRVMDAATIDMSSRVVIAKFVRVFALVVSLLIALPLVGIPLTLLSVFGGALGVGLGFGLQKIASNYVSGFIILLDHSMRMGDLVTVENRHGIVKAINSRYTVLKSLDGTEAIIPNDTFITSIVVNHTHSDPLVLVKTSVTVGYETDMARACAILREAAAAQPRVHKTPAPAAQIKQLGEHGVELELLVWIHDPDQGQAGLRSDMLQYVLQKFREADILMGVATGIAVTTAAPISSAAGQITNEKKQ
jgi:small-conductance mechanosensitive channel